MSTASECPNHRSQESNHGANLLLMTAASKLLSGFVVTLEPQIRRAEVALKLATHQPSNCSRISMNFQIGILGYKL